MKIPPEQTRTNNKASAAYTARTGKKPPWPKSIKSRAIASNAAKNQWIRELIREARKLAPFEKYDPVVFNEICRLVAMGFTYARIAKIKYMPSVGTISSWVMRDKTNIDQMKRAREARALHLAESYYESITSDTPLCGDKSDSARVLDARRRDDGARWYLGKMLRIDYGDSVDMRVSGGVDVRRTIELPVKAAVGEQVLLPCGDGVRVAAADATGSNPGDGSPGGVGTETSGA